MALQITNIDQLKQTIALNFIFQLKVVEKPITKLVHFNKILKYTSMLLIILASYTNEINNSSHFKELQINNSKYSIDDNGNTFYIILTLINIKSNTSLRMQLNN